MILLVHPNEPTEIKEYLRRENIVFREETRLPFDYLFISKDYRIAVERKEANDFITSIEDGRLREQLYFMSALCPLSYLVVVGNITLTLMERKFRRDAYIGALISSTLKRSPEGEMGYVSVLTLDTTHDFMLFLKILNKQFEKGEFVRLPVIPILKRDLKLLQVKTIATLPGVGEVYAKRLIDHFGNIYNVVNASEKDLAKIVGEKRAKKIYSFIRSEI